MTAKNANTNDPDKQWIAIDTNPSSPHYGRVYAMWTVFVLNPSRHPRLVRRRAPGRHAHGLVGAAGAADLSGQTAGTPTCCRTSRRTARVYTTVTNNPVAKGFSTTRST